MNRMYHLAQVLRYYAQAATRYDVHSPFVFDFVENVLEDRRHYYVFEELAGLRRQLEGDRRRIRVTDFGAGSQVVQGPERELRAIARSSLTTPFYAELLFRLVRHYRPQHLLEMGTSLGLTALYQYLPDRAARLLTLEGCPNIAAVAQQQFDAFKAEGIEILIGDFSQTLAAGIAALGGRLDYVFFDGNHRYQPTVDYFEACLPHAHGKSVFVFDDIHWSEEMAAAWRYVQAHERVRLSIDLYACGIVFFDGQILEKQHHTLIPARWKPFRSGFFPVRIRT